MATRRPLRAYVWRAALTALVVVGGLWMATVGVAGVKWSDVLLVFAGVTPVHLAVLAGIWGLGLGIYSLVLSASLPGLGVPRSLLLNLSGSAVANVVPFGGALATALNWKMVRNWGHPNSAFVAFSVLTNALDVLTKLLLPFVAIAALTAWSMHVPTFLWVASACCAGVLVLAVGLRLWFVHQGTRPMREARPGRVGSLLKVVQSQVRESGERIGALVRQGWPRLVPASLAYIAAQVVLLFYALHFVGLDVSVAVVLAAAAVERLGTVAAITPGATGIAEIGTIAWLVTTGLDPAAVVAGVLLYRLFIVVVEIPVGGALLGGWAWTQRMSRQRQTPGLA